MAGNLIQAVRNCHGQKPFVHNDTNVLCGTSGGTCTLCGETSEALHDVDEQYSVIVVKGDVTAALQCKHCDMTFTSLRHDVEDVDDDDEDETVVEDCTLIEVVYEGDEDHNETKQPSVFENPFARENSHDNDDVLFDSSSDDEARDNADTTVACSSCNASFPDQQSLLDHAMMDMQNMLLTCRVCNKRFDSLAAAEKHKEIHVVLGQTREQTSFSLPGSCYSSMFPDPKATGRQPFGGEKSKEDNVNTGDPENDHVEALYCDEESSGVRYDKKRHHTCKTCSMSFGTLDMLARHLYTHQTKYRCNHCHMAFPSQHLKLVHRTKHRIQAGANPYQCHICGKQHVSRTRLKMHMSQHKDEPNQIKHVLGTQVFTAQVTFHCEFCNKEFALENMYQNHMRWHLKNELRKLYECAICENKFKEEKLRDGHEIEHHKEDLPCECEVCGKRCVRKSVLDSHTHSCHGQTTQNGTHGVPGKSVSVAPQPVTLNRSPFKEKRRLYCDYCGFSCSNAPELDDHMESHSAQLPYKCMYCPSRFAGVMVLKYHMAVHKKDKNKPSFKVTGQQIKIPTERLSRGKNYRCSVCGSAFSRLENLKKHLAQHTEVESKISLHSVRSVRPDLPNRTSSHRP